MQKLTGQQRKYLRKLAHSLKPIVMVGKNEITDSLVDSADNALEAHELIKVKFVDKKDMKKELTALLAERTQSQCAGIIGNVAILFREQEDEEKRQIWLSRMR